MKVFVINLDRRPDRLQDISSKLKCLELDFERVSAVDGKKIPHRQYMNKVLAPLYSGPDSDISGAIGCFLSHRAIWRRMVDEGIPQAMILEDDADPVAWDSRIESVNLPDLKLDLLRVGTNKLKNIVTQQPVQDTNECCIGRMLIKEPTYGTCGYIITLEGARKCLMAKKYWFPIDHFHLWKNLYGLNNALIVPPLFAPVSGNSDIIDMDKRDARGVFKKIILSFKRNFRRLIWVISDYYAMISRHI